MRSELEFVGNKYLLFSMLEGQEIKKKNIERIIGKRAIIH